MSRGQKAVPVGNINHDTPEQLALRIAARMSRLTHRDRWFAGVDQAGDVFHLNVEYSSSQAKMGRVNPIGGGYYSKRAKQEWLADDIRDAMDERRKSAKAA